MPKRKSTDGVQPATPIEGHRRISEYKLMRCIESDLRWSAGERMGLDPGTEITDEMRPEAIRTFVEKTADHVVVAAHKELCRDGGELRNDWDASVWLRMLAAEIGNQIENTESRLARDMRVKAWDGSESLMHRTEHDDDMGWGVVMDMARVASVDYVAGAGGCDDRPLSTIGGMDADMIRLVLEYAAPGSTVYHTPAYSASRDMLAIGKGLVRNVRLASSRCVRCAQTDYMRLINRHLWNVKFRGFQLVYEDAPCLWRNTVSLSISSRITGKRVQYGNIEHAMSNVKFTALKIEGMEMTPYAVSQVFTSTAATSAMKKLTLLNVVMVPFDKHLQSSLDEDTKCAGGCVAGSNIDTLEILNVCGQRHLVDRIGSSRLTELRLMLPPIHDERSVDSDDDVSGALFHDESEEDGDYTVSDRVRLHGDISMLLHRDSMCKTLRRLILYGYCVSPAQLDTILELYDLSSLYLVNIRTFPDRLIPEYIRRANAKGTLLRIDTYVR